MFRRTVVVIRIERLPNETPFEYHKRLVYGKLVDKTLSDVDYTELSEYVYGQSYASDVARRMLYGSRRTLDIIEAEREARASLSSAEDILSDIEEKKKELQKERQKFYDQRREYNKLISAEGRLEHLYERLAESADNLSETVGRLFDEERREGLSFNADNSAVLVFSDWHYGMKTDNIFNKYDTEICKERVANVVSKAEEKLRLHQCHDLYIVVLGDLSHGAVHVGARVASEELVCDQLMQVSEILAQAIERLSGNVANTYVYTTYGNHMRTVQNKNDSIHRDNMERIVPWWLNQRFKNNENIVIVPSEDNEFIFLNVCGHNFCASHGDLDSVRSSPKLLSVLFRQKYGVDIEYVFLGDKHHHESFDELGITATICGSLCGSDDYANTKRLYSLPSQFMVIVNAEDGVDAEYKIKC